MNKNPITPSKSLTNRCLVRGKAERSNKIDTRPAEKEETSDNKSPYREISAEDDLKTTILNLSEQIRELQQERSSTSFRHHRFYFNPDLQVYTKKNKNSICTKK